MNLHETHRMTHTSAARKDNKQQESFKETFESIVMAFILAFVFRAFVVEAFVIPTGSMAPTLLGQHADVTCSQCGYRFASDILKSSIAVGYSTTLTCPMCSFPIKIDAQSGSRPGDRILVHKFIYNMTQPKRWDVVVFKNPSNPQDNFIKRLVGLPDEKLYIVDGNIYTHPRDDSDTPWKIQRKTTREIVQRTVWQPVYHSDYYPLDGGKVTADREAPYTWQYPWITDEPTHFQRSHRTWLTYDGKAPATLYFDYKSMLNSQVNFNGQPIGWYPYSQLFGSHAIDSIEDVRVAVRVLPQPQQDQAGQGLGLTFQTTGRIDGMMPVTIRATVAADGKLSLATGDPTKPESWLVRASDQIQPLPMDHDSEVEFWFVDQHVSLWIDRKMVLFWEYEVPMEMIIKRPNPPMYPQTSVAFSGVPATITQIDLDRDLYYSSRPNISHMALGGMYKTGADREGTPVELEPDQFYCLGDNSPFSHDGRYWAEVNPWIEQRMLSDKKQVTGVVPRELMIGKAFFVYFPAPHRLTPTTIGIIPNFGDVRFIH